MHGVVTADIVIPAIVITATAIVAALLGWLDKREAEKEVDKLREGLRQEDDFTVELVKKIRELKKELDYWQIAHDDLLGVPGVKKCLDIEIARLKAKGETLSVKKRKERIEAPAGDEQSPQSQSSSWQVQSYYAIHPSLEGKNPQEASFGENE